MHVAVVSQLPEDWNRPVEGGVAAVVTNLIRGLLEEGVQVTAIQWAATVSGGWVCSAGLRTSRAL